MTTETGLLTNYRSRCSYNNNAAAPQHVRHLHSKSLFMLLCIFIVSGLVVSYFVLSIHSSVRQQDALSDLLSLPMTKHAEIAHQGQYDAMAIIGYIKGGRCKNIEIYACSDHFKVLCQIYPRRSSIWGGLLVGNKIITGFAAHRNYWDKAIIRDRCTKNDSSIVSIVH